GGLYQLIASNTNGCKDTGLLTLVINPDLYLGPDATTARCLNSVADLTKVYFTTGLFTEWTFEGLPVIDPAMVTVPGIYRITANNGGICSDTALVTVVLKANPNIGADKIINTCQSTAVNLNSQYNTTGLTAKWTLNGNSTSSVVYNADVYRIVV